MLAASSVYGQTGGSNLPASIRQANAQADRYADYDCVQLLDSTGVNVQSTGSGSFTIRRIVCHRDLMAEYENPLPNPCPHREGEVFLTSYRVRLYALSAANDKLAEEKAAREKAENEKKEN